MHYYGLKRDWVLFMNYSVLYYHVFVCEANFYQTCGMKDAFVEL